MSFLFDFMKKAYAGNYKLLAIAPLILIAVSLYFIPKIEFGVEFKGGTLISMVLDKKISQEELKIALSKEGIEGKVQVFETATGDKAEIELQHSELLTKADEIKNNFNTKIEEVLKLEYKAAQDSSYEQGYKEKKAEIEKIAGEMFELAGIKTNISTTKSPGIVKKEFNLAYTKIYSDYREEISNILDKYVTYSSISVETVSPLLSIRFLERVFWTVVTSAILTTVFVFLFFRVAAPSIAVICGVVSDILIALGAMGLFGIPFTLASFAALLMLIGFSLDTDILLTMRMLKRSGDPVEKVVDAMRTGMTMSIAAIISFTVLLALAYATRISIYYEIAAVAVVGLIGDLFATWGINAVMMLWYVKEVMKHE